MPKRTASQSPTVTPKAKAAKAKAKASAVVAATAAPQEDPETEPDMPMPVLKILRQAVAEGVVSQTCGEMLRSMAAPCLRSAKAERHEFQSTMGGVLQKVGVAVQDGRQAILDKAEQQVSEAAAALTPAAEALTAAEERISEKRAERDALKTRATDAAAAIGPAESALTQARESEEGLGAELEGAVSEHAELESTVKEKWEPLKSASTPAHQWRQRNKKVELLLRALEKQGAEESLRCTLGVVLKEKAEGRGRFARRALEAGEEVFVKRFAALKATQEGFEAEGKRRSEAAGAAATALQAAEKMRDESANALVKAEQELKQLEAEGAEAKLAKSTLEHDMEELARSCDKARVHRLEVRELFEQCELLLEGSAEEPQAKEVTQVLSAEPGERKADDEPQARTDSKADTEASDAGEANLPSDNMTA